jgi:hypothetical protein
MPKSRMTIISFNLPCSLVLSTFELHDPNGLRDIQVLTRGEFGGLGSRSRWRADW